MAQYMKHFLVVFIVILICCASSTEAAGRRRKDFSKMTVGQLRSFLQERSAECNGCVERRHLIDRAAEVSNWNTRHDNVAAQLSPVTDSARTHMQMHHIDSTAALPPVLFPPVTADQQQHAQVVCDAPLRNGTQYCHPINSLFSQKH